MTLTKHDRPYSTHQATARTRWRNAVATLSAVIVLPATAIAQVPKEFQGDWWSTGAPCEQLDPYLNLLKIYKDSLEIYEVGCDRLKIQSKGPLNILHFAATCSKGGIPASKGTIELSRENNILSLKLVGFSWNAPTVETFHRCQR